MSLRITGGNMRGRLLATPPGHATRPTAARVREAVFSMIGPIGDARVLDLCSGGGTLAFEALSRGAAEAVLVDDGAEAIEAAQRNAEAFDLTGEVRILDLDVVRAVRQLVNEGEQFDLVFLDAPYRDAPRLAARLADHGPELLAPGALVVLEGDRRDPPRLPLESRRERRYGDVLVQILEAAATTPAAADGGGD
jgi:16S rRNA (guanine966-N2)-methyltransferase